MGDGAAAEDGDVGFGCSRTAAKAFADWDRGLRDASDRGEAATAPRCKSCAAATGGDGVSRPCAGDTRPTANDAGPVPDGDVAGAAVGAAAG